MNALVSRFSVFFSATMANFYGFLTEEVIPWVKLHKKGVWLTVSGLSLLIAYLVGSNWIVYSLLAASLAASVIVYINKVEESKEYIKKKMVSLAEVSYDLLSKAVSWIVSKIVNILSGEYGLLVALTGWTAPLFLLGKYGNLPREQAELAITAAIFSGAGAVVLFIKFLKEKSEKK